MLPTILDSKNIPLRFCQLNLASFLLRLLSIASQLLKLPFFLTVFKYSLPFSSSSFISLSVLSVPFLIRFELLLHKRFCQDSLTLSFRPFLYQKITPIQCSSFSLQVNRQRRPRFDFSLSKINRSVMHGRLTSDMHQLHSKRNETLDVEVCIIPLSVEKSSNPQPLRYIYFLSTTVPRHIIN